MIEHFRSYVFVASGSTLYYSQPFSYELFDLENYIQFNDYITLVAALSEGLLIGTSKEIVFLQGLNPDEFNKVSVANYGAVLGTGCKTLLQKTALQDVFGEGVMFCSHQGICLFGNNGIFFNLTENNYSFNTSTQGTASIIEKNGVNQYTCVLFYTEQMNSNHHEWLNSSNLDLPVHEIPTNDGVASLVFPSFT